MPSPRHLVLLATLALTPCLGAHCDGHELDPDLPDPSPLHFAAVLSAISEAPTTIRVRRLRPDVVLHCTSLDRRDWFRAPVSFDASLFGPGELRTITPDTPLALDRLPERPCEIIRLEHPGGEVAIARATTAAGAAIEVHEAGFDLEDYYGWRQGSADDPPVLRACGHLPQGGRLRWSSPVPVGPNLLVESIDRRGPCTRLELRPPGADEDSTFRWEICAGGVALAFEAGDQLSIATVPDPPPDAEPNPSSTQRWVEPATVRIERVATEASRRGEPATRTTVWLSRAGSLVDSSLVDMGHPRLLRASYRPECRITRSAGCGTIELPVGVSVFDASRSVELYAGEQIRRARDDGSTLEVHVLRASHRPLVDPSCSQGRAAAHDDFEIVVVERHRHALQAVAE